MMPKGKKYGNKGPKAPMHGKDPMHQKPVSHGAPTKMSEEGGVRVPGPGKHHKASVNLGMDVNSK